MRWWIPLLLAGCAAGPAAVPGLVPGDAPAQPWWLHTVGCGFCGADDEAWADTLVLGHDGGVLWFSFRPPSGMEGDTWDGVQIPAEHGHLRTAIEAALEVLIAQDVYWTRGGDVHVYDARSFAVDDWPALHGRLQALSHGLQDPPAIEDHGCQDCSMPHVHVVREGGTLGGAVQKRGSFGPGTGNVAGDSPWLDAERTLHALHTQARR